MKVLVCGDPHIKISNLEVGHQFLDWLSDTVDNVSPECVFLMGDLFDTHSIVRIEVFDAWLKYLSQVTKPHVLIKGNHDETAPGSNIHILSAFRDIENQNIKVVGSEGSVIRIGEESFDCLGYIHSEEEFANGVKTNNSKILFCHQSFQGCQFENGYYDPNGFDLSYVEAWRYVISGHIHKSQAVGNVFYPGTPYASSFADSGDQKGVWVLDIVDGDIKDKTFIESPCPKYIVKEFSSSDEVLSFFQSDVSALDRYKVVLSGPKPEIKAFSGSKDFKKIKKGFRVTFTPQYTDIVESRMTFSEKDGIEDILKKYIDEVLDTSLEKEKVHDLAMNILGSIKLK